LFLSELRKLLCLLSFVGFLGGSSIWVGVWILLLGIVIGVPLAIEANGFFIGLSWPDLIRLLFDRF
jgi:hypothetical protein